MRFLSDNLRGALLSLTAFALYSLNDITIKFLGSDYNIIQIVFFSSLASLPMIGALMMTERQPAALWPILPGLTAFRMLLVAVNSFLVPYAFANLPLSQAYAIFFLMPLFICVLAVPMLNETIDLPRGLAVLAGLLGVVVVLRPGVMDLQFAHLSALVGALIGAVYYIVVRKTGGVERMAVMLLYPTLAQIAVMALALPWVFQPMPIQHLGLMALMALEAFVGTLCVVSAYRRAPAVVVAPMQYVQIIVATLFATLLFGEPFDIWTVLGIVIIIAAGLYIMTRTDVDHITD